MVPAAVAQSICTAYAAAQPLLRQEGVSEPAGDIGVSCPQGTEASYKVLVSDRSGRFAGTITSLNPTSAPVGGGQFTLTVTGTGFAARLPARLRPATQCSGPLATAVSRAMFPLPGDGSVLGGRQRH